MEKIVFDSHAFMVYFMREAGSSRVVEWILKGRANKCSILLSVVNWGEIYYSIARAESEQKARDCLVVIDELSVHIVPADQELTLQAAGLKSRYALSYADCFAAALAKREDCPVLTGDKEFRVLPTDIKIIWIQKASQP